MLFIFYESNFKLKKDLGGGWRGAGGIGAFFLQRIKI